MRRGLAGGAIAVASAIVVCVVGVGLGWFSGSAARSPPSRLALATALAPRSAFYGDPVVAELRVTLDPRIVAVRSVRVQPNFGPYVETAPPTVEPAALGRAEIVTYRYALQCVTDGCLPTGPTRIVRLGDVVVTAATRRGHLQTAAVWPTLTVASRVAKADLAGAPRFRRAATPPAAAFGAPAILPDLLTAAGGLLALVAMWLLGLEVRALAVRRRRDATRTPLELALAYAREAADRTTPDRRKALAFLSSALRTTNGDALAAATHAAAWAEEAPSPARTRELAERAIATTEAKGT